jgi:putative FmdB family regulatory protein
MSSCIYLEQQFEVLKEFVMPIYEYLCKKCHCTFEQLSFSSSDPDPQCPTCCTEDVEKLMSAGAIRAKGIPTGSGGFSEPSCKPSGGG